MPRTPTRTLTPAAALRRRIRRWAGARRGATAVEFALIATPFIVLMMGIIEVMMMFFVSTVLDAAVGESARLIRTGQFQANPANTADPLTAFRTDVRARSFGMLGTSTTMHFDVRTFTNFNGVSAPNGTAQIQGGNPSFGFSAGTAEEIVVVRAYIEWQIMTPMLNTVLANHGGNRRIIAATAAFRNEPFPT